MSIVNAFTIKFDVKKEITVASYRDNGDVFLGFVRPLTNADIWGLTSTEVRAGKTAPTSNVCRDGEEIITSIKISRSAAKVLQVLLARILEE